jgi:hypothetical protein
MSQNAIGREEGSTSIEQQTKTNTKREKFIPGNIHKPDKVKFWVETLKANQWVIDLLREGYTIPFTSLPTEYEEDNNASAKNEMEFVRKQIEEWAESGVVSITTSKPICVSPLTVVTRTDSKGNKKKRLCWDGSRHVNTCIQDQKVTLASLQRALELTEEGDFQTKYDLKLAYHHIKITDSHKTYFGAAYTNKKGDKVYFIFNMLAFGVSSAVHCITKLFKPVNAHIHSLGIRHSIFLDDGRSMSKGEFQAEEDRLEIYNILERAGWIVEINKSDQEFESSQRKEYLGFIIDTIQMTVSLTPDKKQNLVNTVAETLKACQKPIKAKQLAKCAGKMIATEPALGRLPLITARPIYSEMEPQVEKWGWSTKITVTEAVIESLKFFLENIEKFDNSPIRTMENQMSVMSIIGEPSEFMKNKFIEFHQASENPEIWAGDASAFAVCAYTVKAEKPIYFRARLAEREKELSSGHRELLTVRRTLEFYEKTKGRKEKATTIYWLTDSENLTIFLTKGSRKAHIQAEVFETLKLARALNFDIEPIHLLREDPRIQEADEGSKATDTDDWSVDIHTFQELNEEWEFTVDLFANQMNAKTKRFFSTFYEPAAAGIDAFAQEWDRETIWACPPVKDIIKCIKKCKISSLEGVLIVPEWQTADFWPFIFDKKGRLLKPFVNVKKIKPFIVSNNTGPIFPMSGHTKFGFLALAIITNKKKKKKKFFI